MQRSLAFSDLISPLTPHKFFDEYQGKTAIQLPGRRRRFAPVFSWAEFNRLLNMTTIWSDATMKVVLDGRELTAKEFCSGVRSREGHNVMQPDPKRVKLFLEQGATVVLDLAERLSEGLAALADMLQAALGAPISCNIYCSWEQHRGFPAHFDTMDVFALQIDGEKTWQLYEGRFENPIGSVRIQILEDRIATASLLHNHHSRFKRPLEHHDGRIEPQLGLGGGAPKPRRLNPASIRIAEAMPTRTRPSASGSRP